jgi:ABC-type uncharacterized transport system permease subunit
VSTATVEHLTGADAPARFWDRQRRLGAAVTGLGALGAVLFGSLAASEPARFTFSEDAAGAAFAIDGKLGAIVFGLLAAAAGVVLLVGRTGREGRFATALLAGGIAAFVLSFLCWQVAGQFLPLVDTARGSLQLALPLILGALAGVLCERSGVVNVAIEGQFLMGAFAAALVGTLAASAWAGLVGAAVGGVLIAAMLAFLAIRYLVDQVVIGVVLNVFAAGVTGFLYEQLLRSDVEAFNQPPRLANWKIPVLSEIPVIGPVLFDASALVLIALVLVVVIHVALSRTRWGLRTRAVGEHPTAADTVGIRVRGLRYTNVLLGGVVAGLGGAYFTLVAVDSFNKGMTNGLGFISLAALIFGRWTPFGALGAALFFGFLQKLATYLSTIGSTVPSQFLNMLPYLATIIAVAGLVGRVRAPAADGKPYVKN